MFGIASNVYPNYELLPTFLFYDGTPTLSCFCGESVKEEIVSDLFVGSKRSPHPLLSRVSAYFHFLYSFNIALPCINAKVAIHFVQLFFQLKYSNIVLAFFTILCCFVFFLKAELLDLDRNSTTVDIRTELEILQVCFEFEPSIIEVVCTSEYHFGSNEAASTEVFIFSKFACYQPNRTIWVFCSVLPLLINLFTGIEPNFSFNFHLLFKN